MTRAAAVACLVADREWFRNRLARYLELREMPDLDGQFGPVVALRPWRIAAGICFGLALGSKWNALYPLAAFALLSLAWDVGARSLAGAGARAQCWPPPGAADRGRDSRSRRSAGSGRRSDRSR